MTVITTSTAATATAYSNQRKIDRCQNGVLWAFYQSPGTTSAFNATYSLDDGTTWSSLAGVPNGSGVDTDTYTENGSIFIDLDDYAHVVFKDNSDGYIYYRRGTPNAGRTAWTWSAAQVLSSDTNTDYPDVVAHREGTGWKAHAVHSRHSGTSGPSTEYGRVDITSGGTLTVEAYRNQIGSYTGSNNIPTWPSIDFNHTGDGKTVAGSTPHLYAAWSAGTTGSGNGIRFKKATYSGGSWTWASGNDEREIDSTRYKANQFHWLNCLFDGTRAIIAGTLTDTGTDYDIVLYERDAADTATTTRVLVANAGLNDRGISGSLTYDTNGNLFFLYGFSADAGTTWSLGYRRWVRSSTTFETLVTIDSVTKTEAYVSAKRGFSDSRIEFIYTDGTASPYDVTYDSISLNTAPNAPTNLSPNGSTIDRGVSNRFSWTFSDPDSGDSQSAYDLRYREQGTSTWTTVSGGFAEYHDFAAGTFTAGDWEWQVRTTDNGGLTGPYSGSATFTAASTPDTPSISDPTNGQTISTENYTVKWTASTQDAYQVRTVADDGAGNPDATTVYQDTGTVVSTGRSRTMTFDTNGRDEHVQVRVRADSLWSSWASVQVTVSYTVPATPTLTATPDVPGNGAIRVQQTHPAPVGDEPTVTSVDLRRRLVVDGGQGIRIRAGVSHIDPIDIYTSRSGVAYEFQIIAHGDNGTSSASAWTA